MGNNLILRKELFSKMNSLSIVNRVELTQELASLLEGSPNEIFSIIELDISQIERMDSMAIAIFVSFSKELTNQNMSLKMEVSTKIYNMFSLLHLTDLLGCTLKDDTNTNSN
jgi:ABC-type transporter Mla MlaB component